MTPTAANRGRSLSSRHPAPGRVFVPASDLEEHRMSFTTCLYVIVGGAFGSLARYAGSVWALPVSRDLPWGTIGINILGSFIIGFFGTLTLAQGRYPVAENIRLFVMIGLCGGVASVSSFSPARLSLLPTQRT